MFLMFNPCLVIRVISVFTAPVTSPIIIVMIIINLLPCLQTIQVSDQDSRTVIGRTRHVTSPIWSRIDWLTSLKICIVGLSFAAFEMDKTVHLQFYLLLSGRS